MTVLGVIFALAYLIALVKGRKWLLGVIAISMPFNDSVIFSSTNVSLSPFYFGLILNAVLSVATWHSSARMRGNTRARGPLVALLVYCFLVTLVSPVIFSGIGVVSASIGLDQQANALTPLSFTTSNVAQMAYLLLNVIFVLGNHRDNAFEIKQITLGLATGVIVASSSFLGSAWPHALFDNSARNFYTTEIGRLRGQFSEPSHLGAFALAATVYFAVTAARTNTIKSFIGHFLLSGLAIALLVACASGTATIGLLVAVVALLLVAIRGRRQMSPIKIPVPIFLLFIGGIVALSFALPRIAAGVTNIIASKSGSTSLTTRTIVDQNALRVFVETFFLGAGSGSNRASSLFVMLLSQIGLIGTLLFIAVVAISISSGLSDATKTPAVLALVAFLSAAFVSLADFSSPIIWGLIACVLCSRSFEEKSISPANWPTHARLKA